MCDTCGCNQPSDAVKIILIGEEDMMHDHHDHDHHHPHDHGHEHHHHHDHTGKTVIELEQDVLSLNNRLAERNRGYFEAKNILALNLVSSPGSGKTAVLERTLADLKDELSFFVIEGDQQTTRDADRIAATGAPVVQINTGKGCHLDSGMVNRAVKKLSPSEGAIVMIENVGNLVCPSLFDLGESRRVVIISVTEGDDKPLKYPDMFHTSDLCIINKTDLLPYVPFDVEKAKHYALHANPKLRFIQLSALTGEGMEEWYQWLKEERGKNSF
jgi:hydrogenase nickel incorporation protein HypB